MRLALKPHPDFPSQAVSSIEVEVGRPKPGALALAYRVAGRIADLAIPPPAEPARADELWRRTCFEAFLKPQPGEAYFEVNLAPSTRWAAYGFSGYREDMSAPPLAAPVIETRAAEDAFELTASLALEGLPTLAAGGAWRLGLSAVIEEAGGRRSYWALAHPAGRPDFHHADAFAFELSPQGAP